MRTKEEIFLIAETLAKESNFLVGDRIEALISRLGGTISYHVPESDIALSLEIKDYSFNISIPYYLGLERSRFSLAHELGHYVLHSNDTNKFKPYCEEPIIWEANWFASAFLMPKEDFSLYCKEYNGDVNRLAIRYLVRPQQVEIRKKQLNF